jgi:hypothetical protein
MSISVFTFYNFCRIHKTLKIAPALAAGVTDKLWSMEDVVALIDAWDQERPQLVGREAGAVLAGAEREEHDPGCGFSSRRYPIKLGFRKPPRLAASFNRQRAGLPSLNPWNKKRPQRGLKR